MGGAWSGRLSQPEWRGMSPQKSTFTSRGKPSDNVSRRKPTGSALKPRRRRSRASRATKTGRWWRNRVCPQLVGRPDRKESVARQLRQPPPPATPTAAPWNAWIGSTRPPRRLATASSSSPQPLVGHRLQDPDPFPTDTLLRAVYLIGATGYPAMVASSLLLDARPLTLVGAGSFFCADEGHLREIRRTRKIRRPPPG